MSIHDVIVIGEGVSGLSAAGMLAQAGLKVATIEGQLFGGLVINVNELDPVPAGQPTSGAELAAGMMQANAEAGVTSIQEPVTLVRNNGDQKEIVTASGSYRARCVIVASGARLKKLGVPGEAEYEGRGVSQCADCDGPMYQNEEVIVVGGGDSALQEALVLAQYCRRVTLVHRRDTFTGTPHFADQVRTNDKIRVIWNATVQAIDGSKMVEKAQLKHADGRTEDLPCAGVFAYIGLEPNVEFLANDVERDANRFLRVNDALQTNVAGVSAIGAVRSQFGGTLGAALDDARRAAAALQQALI
ncbi:MAG TPA: FAD-dependent oxidoreductase [Burkholderiales bacterium]|nr:FAD-dependent oxidoreductase [Burkholderiales bacterium]